MLKTRTQIQAKKRIGSTYAKKLNASLRFLMIRLNSKLSCPQCLAVQASIRSELIKSDCSEQPILRY